MCKVLKSKEIKEGKRRRKMKEEVFASLTPNSLERK